MKCSFFCFSFAGTFFMHNFAKLIVTISVSSSSGIETKTCDTSTESVVTLPLADTSGSCQIDIKGLEYEAAEMSYKGIRYR